MDKLKKIKNVIVANKNVIVANKSVIGQKALQLGGVAVGAFIAGTVLAKTQTETDVIVVDGDVIIEETTTIIEESPKND